MINPRPWIYHSNCIFTKAFRNLWKSLITFFTRSCKKCNGCFRERTF